MKTESANSSPPRTILVPCDFSECARTALQYATVIAKPFGGTLVLLHVIEPVQPGSLIEGRLSLQRQGQMREYARKELTTWMKRYADGLSFRHPLVKAGKPWEVIVSLASRTAADLIVMGTHGFTGLKHAVLGSVAERVVRHAPCPVLTVRSKTKR